MARSLLPGITLSLVAACAFEAGAPLAPPPVSEGAPFEYLVSFVPRDSVFGEGGVVRGVGGSWAFGASSAAFVIELPTTPVSGTPYGGTALVIALTTYPTMPDGLPAPGQYSIGLATVAYAGRGWLRDPLRVWPTNTGGYLLIDAWDGDEVSGTIALRVEQELQSDAGPAPTGRHATVAGHFVARRRR